MSKKNIVIVGGGYAGIHLVHQIEKILPQTHRIVLIDEQDFMYAKIGAARAATAENLSESVLISYDKLFASEEIGVFVNATVTIITHNSVIFVSDHPSEFGSEVPFDYLVCLHPILR